MENTNKPNKINLNETAYWVKDEQATTRFEQYGIEARTSYTLIIEGVEKGRLFEIDSDFPAQEVVGDATEYFWGGIPKAGAWVYDNFEATDFENDGISPAWSMELDTAIELFS